MALNITTVVDGLKYEASEYKKKYDEIKRMKERELKEAEDNYKPGSKMLADKVEHIKNACDSALTKLKVETADRALQDIEALRQQELLKVQSINEPLLSKIRAISNIPMTALELKAIGAKYGVKGDYWANRALADIAEQNGIDTAEIGIDSTFDTKMTILDEMTEHLNSVIKNYGENNPLVPEEEKLKVNYVYFSDDVVESKADVRRQGWAIKRRPKSRQGVFYSNDTADRYTKRNFYCKYTKKRKGRNEKFIALQIGRG